MKFPVLYLYIFTYTYIRNLKMSYCWQWKSINLNRYHKVVLKIISPLNQCKKMMNTERFIEVRFNGDCVLSMSVGVFHYVRETTSVFLLLIVISSNRTIYKINIHFCLFKVVSLSNHYNCLASLHHVSLILPTFGRPNRHLGGYIPNASE